VRAGTLLEGADLRRLEDAHDALFERFWGVRVGQMRDVALNQAREWVKEYRDVIYQAPFQIQVDMLFVLRAIGILSGLATRLDPEFDPWVKTIPYAERFAKEELQQTWQGWLLEILKIGEHTIKLPIRMDRVLADIMNGRIHVENSFSADARRHLQQLDRSIKGLTWVVLAVGLWMSGIYLHVETHHKHWGMLLLGIAFLALVKGLKKG
jgi:predicted unusual protein kinase regulating ubiquinone biosynthesis (AarF/ABC1/UbiB family)